MTNNPDTLKAIDRMTGGKPHQVRDLYLSGKLDEAALVAARYAMWGLWERIQTDAGQSNDRSKFMAEKMGLGADGRKLK